MLLLLQQQGEQQGEQPQQPGERQLQLKLQHEEQQHQQQLKDPMSIQQDLLLLDSMKESFNFYYRFIKIYIYFFFGGEG